MNLKKTFTSIIFLTSLNTYAEYKTLHSVHFTPQSEFVGQIGEHCTFTMISPGVAITAQHCLDDTDNIEVYFNRGRTSKNDIEGHHFVDRVHEVKGKDIAIVEVSPRYERPQSEFPTLRAVDGREIQEGAPSVIMWGYPGSLGSQLAEMDGSVLSRVLSRNTEDFFRSDIVTEGGASGSSLRLESDLNTIIGIHVSGLRKGVVSTSISLELAGAQTLNEREVDEINALISDIEVEAIFNELNKNECPISTNEKSPRGDVEDECDPIDSSQVEIQHIEEPALETYYEFHENIHGESFPR